MGLFTISSGRKKLGDAGETNISFKGKGTFEIIDQSVSNGLVKIQLRILPLAQQAGMQEGIISLKSSIDESSFDVNWNSFLVPDSK